MKPEEIDKHLDAILRASGSALRHYSMQKSIDDMRAALRVAIDAALSKAEPSAKLAAGRLAQMQEDHVQAIKWRDAAEAYRADAERLDWAQENLRYVHQNMSELFQITYVNAKGGPVTLCGQESLRSAIDAARLTNAVKTEGNPLLFT